MRRLAGTYSSLAFAIAALPLGGLHAQSVQPPAEATSDPSAGDQVQDIIVTAQRRNDSLQQTPLAITAISPETLQDRSVRSTQDLMQLVPSLKVTTQTAGNSGGSATFFIRGSGQERSANGTSPAVAIYVDDFYYPSLQGSIFNVLDLQQVEVLRGPQGTLFGRNTVGGAIRYTTKKPAFESEGYVQGTLGSFDRRDINGVLNLAASDGLAIRLTGGRLRTDGFISQTNGGRDAGGTATDLVRAQVRARPSDRLEINLAGQYSRSDLDGYAVVNPGPIAPIPGTVPFIWNTLPAGQANPYDNRYIAQCRYCQSITTDRERAISRFKTVNATVDWRLSDAVALKFLTGWQRVTADFETDLDSSPLPIYNNPGSTVDRATSQELQLNVKGLDNRLDVVTGFYHYDEKHQDKTPKLAPQVILGGVRTQALTAFRSRTIAGFADGTFAVTDTVKIIGGFRYSEDDRQASLTNAGALTAEGSKKFPSTTWRAGAQIQLSSEIMSYLTVSRGFRAGGFSRISNVGTSLSTFEPETATNYELGSRMDLLGGKLRVNPTVFYKKMNDLQVQDTRSSPSGTLIFVQNAAKAHAYGIEVDAEAAVTRDIRLFGNVAVLKTAYDDIGPATSITLTSKFQQAPTLSYGVGGSYARHLSDDLKLGLTTNWSWTGVSYSAPSIFYQLRLPSYGLLNARLELSSNRSWSVAAFVTNLTKKYYFVGGVNYGAAGTGSLRYDVGRPREVGLSTRFGF